MKIIACSLLLFCAYSVKAETVAKRIKSSGNDQKIEIVFYVGEKVVAKTTFKDANDTVGILVGNIPDGPVKVFYENGKLKAESEYRNNKIDGTVKTFYENGNLKSNAMWRNGMKNGLWESYYEDGTLQWNALIIDDKMLGIVKNFHKNGKLANKMLYLDGKPNGPAEYYDLNGILTLKASYSSGSLEGESISYYPGTDRIRYRLNYKNDKLEGVGTVYNKNGDVIFSIIFKDGQDIHPFITKIKIHLLTLKQLVVYLFTGEKLDLNFVVDTK